jgi:2-dehydro-3-deoxyphosphooctonate aldolase (KDO 8-P synthase)
MIIIAGPCAIGSERLCLDIADELAELAVKCECEIIFKASYDKANRTSMFSFRGVGFAKGLRILDKVNERTGLRTLTDVHDVHDVEAVAHIAQVIQIPALLCRQTDLIVAARNTGRIVNVKKGQFMAPADMRYVVEKAGKECWLTERGTFFGYGRLVVDFAGMQELRAFHRPVIFDATHSIQAPGAGPGCSGGNRATVIPMARAAVAAGCDGLFFEVHPNPDKAQCDGPNSISVETLRRELPRLLDLQQFITLREVTR